jgi:hypothetical protein
MDLWMFFCLFNGSIKENTNTSWAGTTCPFKRFLGKSCDIDIKTFIKYTGQTKYSTT